LNQLTEAGDSGAGEILIHPAGWSGGQHAMAAPYSLDLRTRVVAAVTSGQTCRDVAAMFSIAPSTVSNWARRWRESGSPAALPMGGKRPFSLAQERDWVLARLAEKADITLMELQAELKQRGVQVSLFAIWNFLRRERVSFKKKFVRKRAGPRGRRAAARAVEEISGQD
jgi:transposase